MFLKLIRLACSCTGRQLLTAAFLIFTTGFCPLANGQDPVNNAAPDLLQKLRKSGARVQQISSADSAMEISFQLASVEVNDASLDGLESVPNLVWLNLSGTKVSDEGLKVVGKLKDLERLHLEKTAIGDEGLNHLSQLDKLTYLNLYGTRVTDAGLMRLANLKLLRRVYVWQSQATEEGIAKLREALPDCRVIGEVKLAPAAPSAPEQSSDKPADGKETPAEKQEKGGNSQ